MKNEPEGPKPDLQIALGSRLPGSRPSREWRQQILPQKQTVPPKSFVATGLLVRDLEISQNSCATYPARQIALDFAGFATPS